MTKYQIPYVCPECNHDRWIIVDAENDDDKRVKCPECGFEDHVKLSPDPDAVVNGMDELADYLDEKIND